MIITTSPLRLPIVGAKGQTLPLIVCMKIAESQVHAYGTLFNPVLGNMFSYTLVNYPTPHMRSEGSSDCSWTRIYIDSAKKIETQKYSLSEVHFNTGGLIFEFNGLHSTTFAAQQVFLAFANPASVLFR